MSANKNHVIIAFEGLDCSFKETNFKSFVSHLRDMRGEGFRIHYESFPRYGHSACKFVENWLINGTYDRAMMKSNPKIVNTFYSLDRFDYWYGDLKWIDFLKNDSKFNYFVFDRYNLSNTIYNPIYPGEVNIEDFTFDSDNFNIPNPDIIVWMRMKNFDVLADLIAKKKNKDQNELDIEFIRSVWERSEQIIHSNIFEELGIKLIVVDCLNEDNTIKSREELSKFIWTSVCKSVKY